LLPYVECDASGRGADPARCERMDIRRYPTWIIRGKRSEGVLSVDELARLSDFDAAVR
jgi:hypothetical protein